MSYSQNYGKEIMNQVLNHHVHLHHRHCGDR